MPPVPPMTVAITGHTQGIGNAIRCWFERRGHHVIGFSRSNGYDIAHDNTLHRIVEQSTDADVFVNNAYHHFQQTRLLYLLWEHWQGQHRTIVNIASARTQHWDTSYMVKSDYPRDYHTCKHALDEGSKFLWNVAKWPRIMLVKPCAVDTPRMVNYPKPNAVSAEDMADLVCTNMLESRCRVQEINFEANPQ